MYAAVFLPRFSLQAALRWRKEAWKKPVVLSDPATGHVWEATRTAEDHDIRAGMSISQAMGRCPDALILMRSSEQEQAISGLLHETALSHSPLVEATTLGTAILDWRGIHHQLGWHALGDSLSKDLLSVGLHARVAMARSPDVALLAAREAEGICVVRDSAAYLKPLPVAFLCPPEEVLSTLRDWGVETIGDFLRLPRGETIERLGAPVQEMWRIASGRSHRPLRLISPPEVYMECHEFEHLIETTEPLLFLLRRFVDQLSLRLRSRCLVGCRMTLHLPLDDGQRYERIFAIPEPTADAEVMFRILSTHLEQLTLKQQPVGVQLMVSPGIPTRQQLGLFGTILRDPNRFGETVGQLSALAGMDRVGFPQLEDTHKPDSHRMTTQVPWTIESSIARAPTRERLGLPLQRWRPAIRAEVKTFESRPSHLSSCSASGKIVSAQGPYRLSGNWWEPNAWQIEEWDIALADGALYCIARHGKQWLLEGCYDEVR